MTPIQQLESLAQSVDRAAHDLNNVCTSLLGFAELAQDALAAGSLEHGYLTEVSDSGRCAIALAKRLRQIAADLRSLEVA
jgi:signal transduction histidine kinase